MKLSDLLKGIIAITPEQDCTIQALSLDSRTVKSGTLFFALKGNHCDGRSFIADAFSKGASAVVCEEEPTSSVIFNDPRLFYIPDLSAKIGIIADCFFGHPSSKLTMIGITGTNGKTSCSHFIAYALTNAGIPCGIIGTAGIGVPGQLKESLMTTPDSIQLHAQLAEFVLQDVKAVAMEVSSHGLMQNRTSGIAFDYAIFTNLTQDHLDYHGTMENYAKAKRLLFTNPLKAAIINANDSFGRQLIREFSSSYAIFAYATDPVLEPLSVPLIIATEFTPHIDGFEAIIATPWGEAILQSTLTGKFNLSNLLAVLICLCQFEIPFYKVMSLLAQLRGVAGRMESFGGKDLPIVVVDYAHTPDALEKALCALKPHTKGKLWCVFGCGGDRDQSKRPLMGKIADTYSDAIVLTNDNPRHEDPLIILRDIQTGIYSQRVLKVEPDRAQAIEFAITRAKSGDVVLIAGKGHENTQQVGDIKSAFSDQEIVKQVLKQQEK